MTLKRIGPYVTAKNSYLVLMRHAESALTNGKENDFDRPLTENGKGQVRNVAQELKAFSINIEKAFVSSSRRTKETWEMLNKIIPTLLPADFLDELYHADIEEVPHILSANLLHENIIIVIGHNPWISSLAYDLCGEYYDFSPSQIVVLKAKNMALNEAILRKNSFVLDKVFKT